MNKQRKKRKNIVFNRDYYNECNRNYFAMFPVANDKLIHYVILYTLHCTLTSYFLEYNRFFLFSLSFSTFFILMIFSVRIFQIFFHFLV